MQEQMLIRSSFFPNLRLFRTKISTKILRKYFDGACRNCKNLIAYILHSQKAIPLYWSNWLGEGRMSPTTFHGSVHFPMFWEGDGQFRDFSLSWFRLLDFRERFPVTALKVFYFERNIVSLRTNSIYDNTSLYFHTSWDHFYQFLAVFRNQNSNLPPAERISWNLTPWSQNFA